MDHTAGFVFRSTSVFLLIIGAKRIISGWNRSLEMLGPVSSFESVLEMGFRLAFVLFPLVQEDEIGVAHRVLLRVLFREIHLVLIGN